MAGKKNPMVHVIFSGESDNTEQLEDMGLALAMEQGKTGEWVDTAAFLKKLQKRGSGLIHSLKKSC